MKHLKTLIAAGAACVALAVPAIAQEARSMDELLDLVEQGMSREAQQNREREAQFRADKANQQRLLNEAEAERERQQNRSTQLEAQFEENELLIAQKLRQLQERKGSLTELFGHVTSAAGDARATFQTSLTSAEFGLDRVEAIDNLIDLASSSDKLPKMEQLEKLWLELTREMAASGDITRFSTDINNPDGTQGQADVVRVGVWNIITTDGQYTSYEDGELSILARQPAGRFTGAAADLASASSGIHGFGIDPTGPSGGSYLAALIDAPTLEERWRQGGVVGYIITGLGAFALLLALWRLVVLSTMGAQVSSQLKSSTANKNNPLGRVLAVHEENPNMDTETLELKLSEAVLRELPRIEIGLTLLKIISAVAPLLGLLGTVTGMIITFQAITIFGAGDPKAMAGGISSALITTVLGLCVAIPTVLLHTIVSGRAKRIIHVLEEQTTGIIAEHTEGSLRGS